LNNKFSFCWWRKLLVAKKMAWFGGIFEQNEVWGEKKRRGLGGSLNKRFF
jgi:hypothetical protein